MINIEKILTIVSQGVGDKCGCNDDDVKRTKEWIELSKSKDPQNHELLIDLIHKAVAYGD